MPTQTKMQFWNGQTFEVLQGVIPFGGHSEWSREKRPRFVCFYCGTLRPAALDPTAATESSLTAGPKSLRDRRVFSASYAEARSRCCLANTTDAVNLEANRRGLRCAAASQRKLAPLQRELGQYPRIAQKRPPTDVRTLLLIGHNPSLQEFAVHVIGSGQITAARAAKGEVSESSLAIVNFSIKSWSGVRPHGGRLEQFVTARQTHSAYE